MVVTVLSNTNYYAGSVPTLRDGVLQSHWSANLDWLQRLRGLVVPIPDFLMLVGGSAVTCFASLLPLSCEGAPVRWYAAAERVAKHHLSRRAAVSPRRVSELE